MKPHDFKWTNFYESNSDFQYSGLQLDFIEDELMICSTIIDTDNYSILTTRRLLTKLEGQLSIEYIQGAIDKMYGDFKGYQTKGFTFGKVQVENGNEIKYFIETGKASMIMIRAVRTVITITQMSINKVDDDTRSENK
jgi:hypothetical protein